VPNHTDNYFIVAGPKEQVEEFVGLVQDTETSRAVSLQRLVPCPPAFFDRTSPNSLAGFEQCDWYAWCVEHWGTKWDTYDTTRLSTVTHYDVAAQSYKFHTAWSPPTVWLETVAKMLPGLSFVLGYTDEFLGFAGWTVLNAGLGVSGEHEFDTSELDDSFADTLPLPTELLDQLPNRHALAIEEAARADDNRFAQIEE